MRTTIKKFIENFPKEKCFTEPRLSLEGLSYQDKFNTNGALRRMLSANEDRIYYALLSDTVVRKGNKFYVKSTPTQYIWISPTEANIKCSGEEKKNFLNACGFHWLDEIPNDIVNRFFTSSIIKSILIGTIYNQETFYKAVASRIYGIKVSWRTIRDYFNSRRISFNLIDLKYFTKDVEKSMKVIMNIEAGDMGNLLWDVLQSAIKLNEVVDFTWSEKRLKAEHIRQTRTLMQKQLETKEQTPIYDHTVFEGAKLLNTEKDIFIEGSIMHHCLYTCYYNRIKDHRYIAFHMDSPEYCTFGVRLVKEVPVLDQIYLKYDQPVQDSTRKLAEEFIVIHKERLKTMFKQSKEEESSLENWLMRANQPEIVDLRF